MTPRTLRSTRLRRASRATAAALALMLTVAACGGDDDEADEGPTATTFDDTAEATAGGGDAATSAAESEPTVAGEAPDATIAPDLPENVRNEIGAVEVIGDALPGLGRAEVDADPALGVAAPVLVGQDFEGNTVRVDAAANGPTMVVFLAHWCPHCNAEVPRLNELRDTGAFPEGLNVVAVSTALDPSRPNFPPSQWIADVDWTYPVIADGIDVEAPVPFIAAAAFGVDGFPFTALIDAEGNVAARWSGEREPEQVLDLINANLGLG